MEINPIFLSSQLMKSDIPNVYASPGGSILHTLGTLIKPLLSNKPGQSWIFISPHEDSPYLSKIKTPSLDISLVKYLNGLDQEVQMACPFSTLYYNVSTSFVTETQAKLKKAAEKMDALSKKMKEVNMTKEDERNIYIKSNEQSIKLRGKFFIIKK